MNKTWMKRLPAVLAATAVAAVLLAALPAWIQQVSASNAPATMPAAPSPAEAGATARVGGCSQECKDRIAAALKSIEAAEKALAANDAKTAAMELAKAKASLSVVTPAPAVAAAGPIVNSVCPIMGGKFDPAKTPENLTRMYKGQKVGFCCGMCPPQWDKLTDAEKDAKLAKVMGGK